jgi:hypothetical protein
MLTQGCARQEQANQVAEHICSPGVTERTSCKVFTGFLSNTPFIVLHLRNGYSIVAAIKFHNIMAQGEEYQANSEQIYLLAAARNIGMFKTGA